MWSSHSVQSSHIVWSSHSAQSSHRVQSSHTLHKAEGLHLHLQFLYLCVHRQRKLCINVCGYGYIYIDIGKMIVLR